MAENQYARDIIEEWGGDSPVDKIAYAIMRLALAAENIATQLKYLGNGDAATPMGAIEAFGMHIGEKLDAMVDVLRHDD